MVFAAWWRQNAAQRSDRQTIIPANTPGIADDGAELTSARMTSRLANLPVYEIPLLKPLNIGSTDPSSHCGAV